MSLSKKDTLDFASIFCIIQSSEHAARKSGCLRRFRAGENGEGSMEVWAAPRHKPLD